MEQAKAEIRQLRKLALDIQNQLKDENKGKEGGKKREAVFDGQKHDVNATTEYVPKVIDKPANIRQMLLTIVSANILFSSYTFDEHNAIVDAFEKRTVDAGSFIIKQGETGDNFFVIESGTFEVYVKNAQGQDQRVGNTLGNGQSFGELALMYNTPRAASIKAATGAVVWTIDRNTYRGIVVQYKYLRNKQYLGFLREVAIMGKKLGMMMNEGAFLFSWEYCI